MIHYKLTVCLSVKAILRIIRLILDKYDPNCIPVFPACSGTSAIHCNDPDEYYSEIRVPAVKTDGNALSVLWDSKSPSAIKEVPIKKFYGTERQRGRSFRRRGIAFTFRDRRSDHHFQLSHKTASSFGNFLRINTKQIRCTKKVIVHEIG